MTRYHINELGQATICKITFEGTPQNPDLDEELRGLVCPSAIGLKVTFGSKDEALDYYVKHKDEFKPTTFTKDVGESKRQLFREIGNRDTRAITLHDYIIDGYTNSDGVKSEEAYRLKNGYVIYREDDKFNYRVVDPIGNEYAELLPFDGYFDLMVVWSKVKKLVFQVSDIELKQETHDL